MFLTSNGDVLMLQTWPTEEELAQATNEQRQARKKKRVLPRGTSEYQVPFSCDLIMRMRCQKHVGQYLVHLCVHCV